MPISVNKRFAKVGTCVAIVAILLVGYNIMISVTRRLLLGKWKMRLSKQAPQTPFTNSDILEFRIDPEFHVSFITISLVPDDGNLLTTIFGGYSCISAHWEGYSRRRVPKIGSDNDRNVF